MDEILQLTKQWGICILLSYYQLLKGSAVASVNGEKTLISDCYCRTMSDSRAAKLQYEPDYLFAVNELEPVALRRGGIFVLLLTPPALPLILRPLGLRRIHIITLFLLFPFPSVLYLHNSTLILDLGLRRCGRCCLEQSLVEGPDQAAAGVAWRGAAEGGVAPAAWSRGSGGGGWEWE